MRMWVAFIMVAVSIAAAASARADQIATVDMTFQSGATFTGTVDFANDYSSVTGVNGVLTGYVLGPNGYQGTGSDVIDWVYYDDSLALPPGYNFASGNGPYVFGTYLVDGSSASDTSAYNFIAFTYDYSAAPVLTFASIPQTFTGLGNGNDVEDQDDDYSDPMVSGVIYTPEPSSVMLLGMGLLLLGLVGLRRKIRIDGGDGFSSPGAAI
jgi:hypothetical protein